MKRRQLLLAGAAGALNSVARIGAPLSISSLAGCQSRPDDTATLWFSYGGRNRQVLLELVDRFHSTQSKHRIHAVYQGDYFEGLAKLRTAIHAGVPPAVTHVIGEVVPYLAQAEVLDPLDAHEELVDLDLVPALSQSGCFVRGNKQPLWALPFNRSTPIAYINGAVLSELKLSPPTTWDEMRAFAQAATLRSGAETTRWGFECPIDWWFWIALVGQAGGLVVEDGVPTLGGAAGEQALRLWQTLVHQDRSMRPPPGRDFNAWQVTNTDFLAGRTAMIWTSTAFLRYLEDNASFPVVSVPLPKKERFAVPTGGTMFVLPKQGPATQRPAAVAFLQFMMSPEAANHFATGTGYIPVSAGGMKKLEAEGYYEKSPNDRVAVDQLEHALPWPWAPELFRVQREVVQPRLESAVLEQRDVAAVMAEARAAAQTPFGG